MGYAQHAGRMNSLLLTVVGFLIGVILGYMYGYSEDPGYTSSAAGNATSLNDYIAPENRWILEGMNCPSPNCTKTLLKCTGDVARRHRDWVNKQLTAGRSGRDIRNELIQNHGDALFETLPGASQDST